MKILANKTYVHTFELWVETGDTAAPYAFDSTQKGNVVGGRNQSYMQTPEPLPYAARIRNAVDQRGNLLFEEGGESYDVFVNSNEPVIDIYGIVVGYRQLLRRTSPRVTITGIDQA